MSKPHDFNCGDLPGGTARRFSALSTRSAALLISTAASGLGVRVQGDPSRGPVHHDPASSNRPSRTRARCFAGLDCVAAATAGAADILSRSVLGVRTSHRARLDAKDRGSGFVGFVTTFLVQDEFSKRYPVQLAGGRSHEELWVPAAELDEFNAHILGSITVLEAYPGDSFVESLDPETKVPLGLSEGYRARPRARERCIVRRAAAHHVDASVALLIASITTLCADDHSNDPETLARWLSNKTTAQFEQWLADPENVIVIAEQGSVVCGVALLHSSGTIRLCYVLPGMQRCGVGRALIRLAVGRTSCAQCVRSCTASPSPRGALALGQAARCHADTFQAHLL